MRNKLVNLGAAAMLSLGGISQASATEVESNATKVVKTIKKTTPKKFYVTPAHNNDTGEKELVSVKKTPKIKIKEVIYVDRSPKGKFVSHRNLIDIENGNIASEHIPANGPEVTCITTPEITACTVEGASKLTEGTK